MQGLALSRGETTHEIPTFEVKGLIRGAQTLDTFDATGVELEQGLNEAAFDGITDYATDDLVLLKGSQVFDDDADEYVAAPELDGVYRIVEVGHSHQNPLLERATSMASLTLIEVTEGTYFHDTFWKNLTLVSSYVEDESDVILEQLVEIEP